MTYFVKIENNEPVSGVITKENLLYVYPNMDVEGLPREFVKVKKADSYPKSHPLQNWLGTKIVYKDNEWVEEHQFEFVSEEEAIRIKDAIKREHKKFGFPSWIWNEEECCYLPPTPCPDDGKKYDWNEESLSWVEQPVEK